MSKILRMPPSAGIGHLSNKTDQSPEIDRRVDRVFEKAQAVFTQKASNAKRQKVLSEIAEIQFTFPNMGQINRSLLEGARRLALSLELEPYDSFSVPIKDPEERIEFALLFYEMGSNVLLGESNVFFSIFNTLSEEMKKEIDRHLKKKQSTLCSFNPWILSGILIAIAQDLGGQKPTLYPSVEELESISKDLKELNQPVVTVQETTKIATFCPG